MDHTKEVVGSCRDECYKIILNNTLKYQFIFLSNPFFKGDFHIGVSKCLLHYDHLLAIVLIWIFNFKPTLSRFPRRKMILPMGQILFTLFNSQKVEQFFMVKPIPIFHNIRYSSLILIE